jgi:broad specificity phosphatase PhoE
MRMVHVMNVAVLVVQHGEKSLAAGDPGLTENGVRQAAAVAEWLRRSGIDVGAVWASPLTRAQQTAAPIAAAFGLPVQTDARLRERVNWDHECGLTFEEFLAEWKRGCDDRAYEPTNGDSSIAAADRFIAAVIDIGRAAESAAVVVVTHGGITVDATRTLTGAAAADHALRELVDHGVPCGAITRMQVDGDAVSVVAYPSTRHLASHLEVEHEPACMVITPWQRDPSSSVAEGAGRLVARQQVS